MPTPEQLPQAKPINTRSAHNVKLWIVQGIAEGRLKKCWNLGIDMVDVQKKDAPAEDVGRSYFVPVCRHDSFETRYGYMDDNQHLTLLQRSLHTNPISCPKNCTYYENVKWGWLKSNAARVLKNLHVVLKGYAALPWQTQVTIIAAPALVLILWKSPKWVPLIVSLLKAIWGK